MAWTLLVVVVLLGVPAGVVALQGPSTGFVEICKVASGPTVGGVFRFTVGGVTTDVPVGACSPAIEVPAGIVTVSEAERAGISVSDVSTLPDTRLVSVDLADRAAEIRVVAGDVSTQTAVTFTNKAEIALLKICKVAGDGIAVGTSFSFTAGTVDVPVPAGPPPGGSCSVAGWFPVATYVAVTESIPSGTEVSAIGVAPPDRVVGAANLAGGSVIVRIASGVTEVTFTNRVPPAASTTTTTVAPGPATTTTAPAGASTTVPTSPATTTIPAGPTTTTTPAAGATTTTPSGPTSTLAPGPTSTVPGGGTTTTTGGATTTAPAGPTSTVPAGPTSTVPGGATTTTTGSAGPSTTSPAAPSTTLGLSRVTTTTITGVPVSTTTPPGSTTTTVCVEVMTSSTLPASGVPSTTTTAPGGVTTTTTPPGVSTTTTTAPGGATSTSSTVPGGLPSTTVTPGSAPSTTVAPGCVPAPAPGVPPPPAPPRLLGSIVVPGPGGPTRPGVASPLAQTGRSSGELVLLGCGALLLGVFLVRPHPAMAWATVRPRVTTMVRRLPRRPARSPSGGCAARTATDRDAGPGPNDHDEDVDAFPALTFVPVVVGEPGESDPPMLVRGMVAPDADPRRGWDS